MAGLLNWHEDAQEMFVNRFSAGRKPNDKPTLNKGDEEPLSESPTRGRSKSAKR